MVVAEEQIVIVDEWRGLYSESWKGVIVDDAFAHPAKFSRALIRKIYDHVIAEGWATKGDSVVDPFGGVALGGFDAMRHGLNWSGCELEQKFVELGGRNIALWNERYSRMPNWGAARLLQGDSRQLCEVLQEASFCVSSPPYAGGCAHTGGDDPKPESVQGGAYHGVGLSITSPPYANDTVNERNGIDLSLIKKPGGHNSQSRTMAGYGEASGQLGAMREGDHSIAISSPPYAGSDLGGGDGQRKMSGSYSAEANKATKNGKGLHGNYGKTDGQLGAMPEGKLCVTSPPFESSLSSGKLSDTQLREMAQRGHRPSASGQSADYGSTEGNLGNMRGGFDAAISSPPYEGSQVGTGSGERKGWRGYTDHGGGTYANEAQLSAQPPETFWSASRLILEQLHQVLTPNARAVFVVKSFVRDKRIVDFPAQWAQLCEAVGFKLLHDHHALLTEHYGTQGGFESDKHLRVERKSFFRRLAEQKGSPRIDYENVLCFRKVA